MSLNPTQRAELDESGYVVLRGLLEPAVLAGVRFELEALVEQHAGRLVEEGVIPHAFRQEPFETRLWRVYERRMEEAPKQFRENLHRPGLYPLFFHPALLDLVASVLGPEIRLYPNYTARPKLPESAVTEVLWHQDGAYTQHWRDPVPIESVHMVNVWAPLVRATVQNGCMQFVPGSHKMGLVAHEEREHYLEIIRGVIEPLEARAVPIELDPGDVVLFHNLLFHRGLPNRGAAIRWSLDWRYQDAREPTYREQHGHLARSILRPGEVVTSAAQWARLTFV